MSVKASNDNPLNPRTKEKSYWFDFIFLILFSFCAFILCLLFDVFEWFVTFTRNYEQLDLDEIAAASIFVVIALAVFYGRRSRDLSKKIKELTLSENALRESEERFRAIAESTPDGLVLSNMQGEIIFLNSSAEKIFGYTQQELLGKSSHILLPEELSVKHQRFLDQISDTADFSSVGTIEELSCIKKDGTAFPVEISLSMGTPAEQSLYCGIIRDITRRKEAESELQNTRDFLFNAIESSLDAIVLADATGKITRVNKALSDLLGYTKKKCSAGPPDSLPFLKREHMKALPAGLSLSTRCITKTYKKRLTGCLKQDQ